MQKRDVEEIIACLPRGKTPFYYFKDRYALMLLSYFVGSGKTVQEVKKSGFGGLLAKPLLKDIMQSIGNGVLTSDILETAWPLEPECYLLTLGKWGEKNHWWSFNQTSRQGRNLVLQLNFSSKHNRPYYKLIKPTERHPFEYSEHPIARNGYHTLAWARLDIELDDDEALIEEIQNDWIRLSILGKTTIEAYEENENGEQQVVQRRFRGVECNAQVLKTYVEKVLQPHIALWDEAMLAAAIWFLKEEVGIKSIFYHTYETGNKLKGIIGKKPPKSLYSTLPRRFCFQETERIPGFLYQKKNRRNNELRKKTGRFYLLEF